MEETLATRSSKQVYKATMSYVNSNRLQESKQPIAMIPSCNAPTRHIKQHNGPGSVTIRIT